jgi:hypothetical protein
MMMFIYTPSFLSWARCFLASGVELLHLLLEEEGKKKKKNAVNMPALLADIQ